MSEFAWKSPLAHLLEQGSFGATPDSPGVEIRVVRRSLYSVTPATGRHETASDRLQEFTGLSLPEVGSFSQSDGISLLWAGFGIWMLAGPLDGASPDFGALREALQETAAVADHSDGRCMLRISGSAARFVLSKMCAVDLHPRHFHPGSCAATRMGHINAHLHQLDDAPSYEIHVFRAFAESFFAELTEAAASEGYRIY
ncbi:MAG: sarcosine oxidase subunit gamma [Sulfitobacter sp.]|nr:sarcosine oxidase subunit gamma [Sulfitobacter sp.]